MVAEDVILALPQSLVVVLNALGGVIMLYFIMNGVIEQLFLYPAWVGEALGLNTLETIIIVLRIR